MRANGAFKGKSLQRDISRLAPSVILAIKLVIWGAVSAGAESTPAPTNDLRPLNSQTGGVINARRTVAQIKELHGAPAIFINDEPSAALMYETRPQKLSVNLPSVSGGRLKLQNRPEMYGMTSRSVKSTGSFGRSFVLEAEVCVEEITGPGPNIVFWVNNSGDGCYFFHLVREPEGNVVHLWKAGPGAKKFDKWFMLPLNWKLGEPVKLKLVIDNGKITGYANGRLVGEKVDENPLAPAGLTISVYHSISTVNFVRVTGLDGSVIFDDDFSAYRPENWSGVHPNGDVPTFASAGLNIGKPTIRLADRWTGPGQYDLQKLDTDIRSVLKNAPGTYIIGRLNLNPPKWWIDAHPEEIAGWRDAAGNSGRLLYASFPSASWLSDAGEAVDAIIKHIEASDYAGSIIGYNLLYAWGPEWEHPSSESAFHDYSPANLRAFKEWLRNKYGTDAALSRAWNRPDATIEGAEIPPVSDRLTGDNYEFFNPSGNGNRIADYIRFDDESVVSAIGHFARIIKEATGNRNQVFAHYGYHFIGYPSINYSQRGHQAMDRFLACPDIDGTGSAYQYRVREAGGSTVPVTTVGSLRLHGKMYILEDDTRTHLSTEDSGCGRARDLWETTNILKRNAVYTISEGVPLWYLDMGSGWFEHAEIMSAIAQIVGLHKEALKRDRRRNAEIAVIVNQRSVTCLRSSNALTVPVLAKQYFEQLPRLGAPFDTYLLQDLDSIPDYKLYIFLDDFALNEQEKESIRRVVRRSGHTALWIYAPGYITEKGLSAEAISEITGIDLLVRNVGGQLWATLCDLEHPITANCSPGLEWGTLEPIGPIIACRDRDATILGMLHAVPGTDRSGNYKTSNEFEPGLVVKEMGGWKSVWSGVPDLPADLLRGIARYAGVHIYSDGDDFICANNSMVSIHTRYTGKRTINLPKPARVVDAFTGKVISERTTAFSIDLKKYETRMWWLEDPMKVSQK